MKYAVLEKYQAIHNLNVLCVNQNSLNSYDAAALIKNEKTIILLPISDGEFSIDEETKGRLKFYVNPIF